MSKNGNILLVANWESNVGYAWWLMENFWTTISNHYENQGIRCHLIYPRITLLPDAISKSSIEVHECDFQNHNLKNLNKILQLIKTNHINYLYLSDSPTYSFMYILLRFWGIKKIIIHDHTPGERTRAKLIKKWLKSLVQMIPYYTADHFISVTKYVYQRHINVNCIPANKCTIAQNGITPINLTNIDKHYAHKAFNIPSERYIIVTTGRASYYKGIDFFIECAADLINRQSMKNLHFLFCGDGPDMGSFKNLVKQLNIENHFTFAGNRTDIRSILPSCHVGFHAASGEVGYSLSILEYMSAGLITVVPNTPSVSLATKHMESGILYQSRNISSATEAIKTALSTECKQTVRDNAVQSIQEEFNIKTTNQQLINITNKVFN